MALEVRCKTLDPLVADGDGGSQYQGWLAEAADEFQAENRLARSGSGDNVDAVILLQAIEAFEDALLIRPEGPGKAPAGLRLCLGRYHAGKSNRSGPTPLLDSATPSNDGIYNSAINTHAIRAACRA